MLIRRNLSAMTVTAVAAMIVGTATAQRMEQSDTNSAAMYSDEFKGHLGPGWYWLREHKEGWRITDRSLEVLIEPGNMWGPQNDARNVLVRPAPSVGVAPLIIEVIFDHSPTNQYEQADLVWYLDDSNMVKLGEELVDGQLSVVMGREQNDKTRTISITPLKSNQVHLKMIVSESGISGAFQMPGADRWTEVGHCELPKSSQADAAPKISMQFYQGVNGSRHWARVTDFRISTMPKRTAQESQ
jgi:regulation of enolase protein 1 (concanavalin A-like superfamily)